MTNRILLEDEVDITSIFYSPAYLRARMLSANVNFTNVRQDMHITTALYWHKTYTS